MKKIIIAFTCLFSTGILFNSCSVEKRHYMNGYHVEWNKNNKNAVTVADKAATAQSITQVQAIAPVQQETAPAAVVTNAVNAETIVAPVAAKETKASNFSAPVIAKTTAKGNETTTVNSDVKTVKQTVKAAKKAASDDGVSKGLLYVLCFLLPWLAVGLATDWNVKQLIINLLLSLTCIGAIIHALVIVSRSTK